jgi:hypothetical protein
LALAAIGDRVQSGDRATVIDGRWAKFEAKAMARLRPLSKEEAPEEARPLMEAVEKRFGQPSGPAGIQARCPPILKAGQGLGASVEQSNTLPAELRSLVCIRVAQIVACPF